MRHHLEVLEDGDFDQIPKVVRYRKWEFWIKKKKKKNIQKSLPLGNQKTVE